MKPGSRLEPIRRLRRLSLPAEREKEVTKECSVELCEKDSRALGLCHMHHRRLKAHGTTDIQLFTRPENPLDRFWRKVDKSGPVPPLRPDLGNCWVWTGSRGKRGYASYRMGKGAPNKRVHRISYELLVGEIPDEYVVDHLCKIRFCVNPDHLEAVSNRENILRSDSPSARNARKTHCIRGHEFSPSNTGIRNDGSRYCKACVRLKDNVEWEPPKGYTR